MFTTIRQSLIGTISYTQAVQGKSVSSNTQTTNENQSNHTGGYGTSVISPITNVTSQSVEDLVEKAFHKYMDKYKQQHDQEIH